jgi:hypothetical protein
MLFDGCAAMIFARLCFSLLLTHGIWLTCILLCFTADAYNSFHKADGTYDEEGAKQHVDKMIQKLAMGDDDQIITHLFFAPAPLALDEKLDDTWRMIFSCDGATLKNKVGGTVLDAVLKDANHNIQAAAFMVTVFNESYESWLLFLQFLKGAYAVDLDQAPNNMDKRVFISDGCKGAKKAFEEKFPNVHRRLCTFHVGTKLKGEDADLFKEAVTARTTERVERLVSKMSETTKAKVETIGRGSLFNACCPEAHGESTSNASESKHAEWLKHGCRQEPNIVGKNNNNNNNTHTHTHTHTCMHW